MEWLKLFTLLVAVASISVKADGPKKKIRIHLPQKVKHIHHHKKIYIQTTQRRRSMPQRICRMRRAQWRCPRASHCQRWQIFCQSTL